MVSRPDLFDEHCHKCGRTVNMAPDYDGTYDRESRTWTCDECKGEKKMKSRRIQADNLGVQEILPFTEQNKSKTYYQVVVGAYGVVMPKTINVDTLDGLQLVDGKASAIHDRNLAGRVAEKTGGKFLEVTERFIREVVEEKL